MYRWYLPQVIKNTKVYGISEAMYFDILEVKKFVYFKEFTGIKNLQERKLWRDLEWKRRLEILERGIYRPRRS